MCSSDQKPIQKKIIPKKSNKKVIKKPIKKVKITKKIIQAPKIIPLVKKEIEKPKIEEIIKKEKKEPIYEQEKVENIILTQQTEESNITQTLLETKIDTAKMQEEKYINNNLDVISQLLSDNLYYPRRARKRGIVGEVVVRFKISTDARVSQITTLSSNSEILSRAAIKTIKDLSGKFPKPTEELILKIPINYSLTKE